MSNQEQIVTRKDNDETIVIERLKRKLNLVQFSNNINSTNFAYNEYRVRRKLFISNLY